MKILFPIGSLYPAQTGGPSNTIYWLAKALSRKGVLVKIVTSNKDIENGNVVLDKWLVMDYGKVRYCKTLRHYLPLSVIRHSLKALRTVDLIHLTALFYPPSLLTALMASFIGKPIVWSVRGELHPSALKYSALRKRVYLLLIRSVKHKITFHATSPEEAECIKKNFGKTTKVVQIPNYIELPSLIISQETNRYLLFIGRIHPIKALEKLIEAVGQSHMFMNGQVVLRIVGNGEPAYISFLINRVKELKLDAKITFQDAVLGHKKQQLYADAKFTLLVSESENFGNVVVESLSQCTPVIASLGTPWQILERKCAGYHTSNDPLELSKKIDEALSLTCQQYEKMRSKARELAENDFDIKRNIGKWISVYHDFLNSKN